MLWLDGWKTNTLRQVHAGNKVEFNTVDFVQSPTTKSTLLLSPHTHWQQRSPYRQQSRPRQAVKFKLLTQ